jgi:competence protein ComEA
VPASSGAASTVIATTEVPAAIVVHVAGAVMVPGIHRLPAAARVADAVLAAGGLAPDAHADAINLAATLHDGDRVYVPRVSEGVAVPVGVTGTTSGTGGGSGEPPGPVSINAATIDELDALPGVGPATAAAIVAHREQFGPFSSIEGLADVRGIGPAKLDAIRALISL